MPHRKEPLVTGEIYHVFNRSIGQQPIFAMVYTLNLFTDIIEYYHFQNTALRYSFYKRLSKDKKVKVLDNLYIKNKLNIEIFSFSLMPNHFHLLVKQKSDNGISNFIRLSQDSFARWFNQKYKRYGSLFQASFKSVRIENDEQFLHVSRYIHLNPLTSYIIKGDLEKYRWNSFRDYIRQTPRKFINTELIKTFFINNSSFKDFTFNQLDYQRKLNTIKHLVFESYPDV